MHHNRTWNPYVWLGSFDYESNQADWNDFDTFAWLQSPPAIYHAAQIVFDLAQVDQVWRRRRMSKPKSRGLLKGGSRRDDQGPFKRFLFGEKLYAVRSASVENCGHLLFRAMEFLRALVRPADDLTARLFCHGCSFAASKEAMHDGAVENIDFFGLLYSYLGFSSQAPNSILLLRMNESSLSRPSATLSRSSCLRSLIGMIFRVIA